MQKSQTRILGFYQEENDHLIHLKNQLKGRGVSFQFVQLSNPYSLLNQVFEALIQEENNDFCIVLDLEFTLISPVVDSLCDTFSKYEGDVVFAASPHFIFDNQDLYYFYWKHYPRIDDRYNYLDASAFCGRKDDIIKMISSIKEAYPSASSSSASLMSRFYADQLNGCFNSGVKVRLDYKNLFFASTRLSATRHSGKMSWIYELLHRRNEKEVFSSANLTDAMRHPVGLTIKKESFYHLTSRSNPGFVSLAADRTKISEYLRRKECKTESRWRLLRLALTAHYRTIRQLIYIIKVNKGKVAPERIFRYTPNKSKELDSATRQLVNRLEQKQPVSFAHYNDGELTFIRDFLDAKNHDKWFGRKQQQYNPLLAERLYQAMRFKKEGYYVGVPCGVHHKGLRQLADEIVEDYEFKVQAMTLHHNLAYMPRILHALKGRDVYFFTNEYQDLSLFKNLGINVDPKRVEKVPFRNSYLEYEKYQDMKFPAGAVVVLTCGMLAKILTKVWYENHDDLTVLALGSSLDDHIQKENIQFELYPKDLPLTKNLRKSRGFLFGYKKRCKECYLY